MRHAQSVEKQIGQRDEARELTPEGIKEALLIGNYLFQQKISPDCILCSPAERAKGTASLISEALKVDPERIFVQEELYEASTRTFFQFIGTLEDFRGTILCIGHNPAISYLAEYLTKAEVGDMVPAGLAMIRFNIQSWKEVSQGNGELEGYITPQMLKL